ncbi:YhcH/YjgK/YiaL family protein [Ructibacterium gallinarum]|uniref:YhcH/YjgK/YiaL family protein n=1 Tax=Ructibacterium gallinarum TaxID=2779355 RepID=A0A9D5R8X7_9FIRM|nr:YhcH/YjgK/YiaL family protein [Ructibacterium gallinarum]MBE5040465.1 YhcH/YjgK/YiaL family protein [Ructibacterium gallinarum]
MVFGNIKDMKYYDNLEEEVQQCFNYAKEHDLVTLEKGTHTIDGDQLFVNIVEYETTTPENRFWEAHRYYLDLHLMLSGTERIDTGFIDRMEQKEFVEKDDFLPLDGEANGHAVLNQGDFLLCYPVDAHRTAVQVNGPVKVKKAIFKIKIKD